MEKKSDDRLKQFDRVRIGRFLIDESVFISRGCTCTANCCRMGAELHPHEVDVILDRRDDVVRVMDYNQVADSNEWFVFDGTFFSTQHVDGRCVFQSQKDGACALQRLAVKDGIHKWTYKPIGCWTFPIELTDNLISVDAENMVRVCTLGRPIIETCAEELTYILGGAGYRQLVRIARERS